MKRRRSLSDEERALWDTVTRAVAPLRRRKAKKVEADSARRKLRQRLLLPQNCGPRPKSQRLPRHRGAPPRHRSHRLAAA